MASILIIDDQPWVQELLMEELTCEGYQVAAMCDAKSAVENLADPLPDLVVLDLYLGANSMKLFLCESLVRI